MIRVKTYTFFLGVVLVTLFSGKGAYCAPTSTDTSETGHGLHTTLSSNNVHLPGTTLSPRTTELTKTTEENVNFNARLVISNSRANGSSVWGLTQAQAEETCKNMAKQRSSMSDILSKLTDKSSPLANLFKSIHNRFLNRFGNGQKFEYGSLFSIHNMGQLELFNNLFSQFFPPGTVWTGGKLVKKEGRYVLTWLDDKEHNDNEDRHPDATELLRISETEIQKLANDNKICLVLKKTMNTNIRRRLPFHFYPIGWSKSARNWRHTTTTDSTAATQNPTTTTSGFSATTVPTVAPSTKQQDGNGVHWELSQCDEHLPYACLLHHETKETKNTKTDTTHMATESTNDFTTLSTENNKSTEEATTTEKHFPTERTDDEKEVTGFTHIPTTVTMSRESIPQSTDLKTTLPAFTPEPKEVAHTTNMEAHEAHTTEVSKPVNGFVTEKMHRRMENADERFVATKKTTESYLKTTISTH